MSEPVVPEFLLDWARREGPAKVLTAVRARMEAGKLGTRSVVKLPLSTVERREVGRLLPAQWTASRDEKVPVRALQDALAHHGTTLEALLTALGGPLRNLPAERRQELEAEKHDRAEALAELKHTLAAPLDPELDAVVTAALDHWVLRGGAPRERAQEITRILRGIPAAGDLPLAALAANEFADAHALDRSRPLGRAMARFLAIRSAAVGNSGFVTAAEGVDSPTLPFSDPLESPDAWRAAWASARVTCDTVSSQVLVLNLPLVGEAPAVAWCAATPGEPVWLTLRSLQGRFELPMPQDVFVCENPTIVEAAANASGAHGRPLVCTFGRPSSAAWKLLRGLAPQARLHIRADGDAYGWSIAENFLAAFPAALPWRMPPGTTAFEEELLDLLLADLAGGD